MLPRRCLGRYAVVNETRVEAEAETEGEEGEAGDTEPSRAATAAAAAVD